MENLPKNQSQLIVNPMKRSTPFGALSTVQTDMMDVARRGSLAGPEGLLSSKRAMLTTDLPAIREEMQIDPSVNLVQTSELMDKAMTQFNNNYAAVLSPPPPTTGTYNNRLAAEAAFMKVNGVTHQEVIDQVQNRSMNSKIVQNQNLDHSLSPASVYSQSSYLPSTQPKNFSTTGMGNLQEKKAYQQDLLNQSYVYMPQSRLPQNTSAARSIILNNSSLDGGYQNQSESHTSHQKMKTQKTTSSEVKNPPYVSSMFGKIKELASQQDSLLQQVKMARLSGSKIPFAQIHSASNILREAILNPTNPNLSSTNIGNYSTSVLSEITPPKRNVIITNADASTTNASNVDTIYNNLEEYTNKLKAMYGADEKLQNIVETLANDRARLTQLGRDLSNVPGAQEKIKSIFADYVETVKTSSKLEADELRNAYGIAPDSIRSNNLDKLILYKNAADMTLKVLNDPVFKERFDIPNQSRQSSEIMDFLTYIGHKAHKPVVNGVINAASDILSGGNPRDVVIEHAGKVATQIGSSVLKDVAEKVGEKLYGNIDAGGQVGVPGTPINEVSSMNTKDIGRESFHYEPNEEHVRAARDIPNSSNVNLVNLNNLEQQPKIKIIGDAPIVDEIQVPENQLSEEVVTANDIRADYIKNLSGSKIVESLVDLVAMIQHMKTRRRFSDLKDWFNINMLYYMDLDQKTHTKFDVATGTLRSEYHVLPYSVRFWQNLWLTNVYRADTAGVKSGIYNYMDITLIRPQAMGNVPRVLITQDAGTYLLANLGASIGAAASALRVNNFTWEGSAMAASLNSLIGGITDSAGYGFTLPFLKLFLYMFNCYPLCGNETAPFEPNKFVQLNAPPNFNSMIGYFPFKEPVLPPAADNMQVAVCTWNNLVWDAIGIQSQNGFRYGTSFAPGWRSQTWIGNDTAVVYLTTVEAADWRTVCVRTLSQLTYPFLPCVCNNFQMNQVGANGISISLVDNNAVNMTPITFASTARIEGPRRKILYVLVDNNTETATSGIVVQLAQNITVNSINAANTPFNDPANTNFSAVWTAWGNFMNTPGFYTTCANELRTLNTVFGNPSDYYSAYLLAVEVSTRYNPLIQARCNENVPSINTTGCIYDNFAYVAENGVYLSDQTNYTARTWRNYGFGGGADVGNAYFMNAWTRPSGAASSRAGAANVPTLVGPLRQPSGNVWYKYSTFGPAVGDANVSFANASPDICVARQDRLREFFFWKKLVILNSEAVPMIPEFPGQLVTCMAECSQRIAVAVDLFLNDKHFVQHMFGGWLLNANLYDNMPADTSANAQLYYSRVLTPGIDRLFTFMVPEVKFAIQWGTEARNYTSLLVNWPSNSTVYGALDNEWALYSPWSRIPWREMNMFIDLYDSTDSRYNLDISSIRSMYVQNTDIAPAPRLPVHDIVINYDKSIGNNFIYTNRITLNVTIENTNRFNLYAYNYDLLSRAMIKPWIAFVNPQTPVAAYALATTFGKSNLYPSFTVVRYNMAAGTFIRRRMIERNFRECYLAFNSNNMRRYFSTTNALLNNIWVAYESTDRFAYEGVLIDGIGEMANILNGSNRDSFSV